MLLLGLLLVTSWTAGQACTTFCLVDSSHIVFGRNFDYYCADGRVMVNRRGLQKTAFWTNSGFRWVSRFGSVTTNQFGHEFPNGGLNEAGLVIEHMLLDDTVYANDARPALTELQWVQYQLDCSASVAEVLASDQQVRIASDSSHIHFLVADRSGRCAVIEFLNGQMVARVDDTLPVAALTNHRYTDSLAYEATTAPATASHTSSLGRFVHAANAVRTFTVSGAADPIGYAFDALANVNQPNWTRWSIVYDIGNLAVHFRTLPAFAIKTVRLSALDFRPEAQTVMMDINTSAPGEVTPPSVYSTADNFAVLTAVYRQTTPLATVSSAYLQRRAAYPDSVTRALLPAVETQPLSRTVTVGDPVELTVGASAGAAIQWLRNGRALAGETRATLRIASAQPADAGIYTAMLTTTAGSVASEPAVVGLSTAAKVLGAAYEYQGDIRHAASGAIYDQFLLTGSAASLTADPGQVSRISFIDLSDDIVQVEFSGPGTLTLLLDGATGPARPTKYNQDVSYMRGHATVVLSGTTANTHVSIFSAGTVTNPGVVKSGEVYDGHADLAALAIQSGEGRLAAIRCGNAAFINSAGAIGVIAPGVVIEPGPVNIHDVCAGDSAAAFLLFGSVPQIRITGGDLYQSNGGAIRTAGVSPGGLLLAAGTSSAAVLEPARPLRGRLEQGGLEASEQLISRSGAPAPAGTR